VIISIKLIFHRRTEWNKTYHRYFVYDTSKGYTRYGPINVLTTVFFAWAILSWCSYTWPIVTVYNTFPLNISSIYMIVTIRLKMKTIDTQDVNGFSNDNYFKDSINKCNTPGKYKRAFKWLLDQKAMSALILYHCYWRRNRIVLRYCFAFSVHYIKPEVNRLLQNSLLIQRRW